MATAPSDNQFAYPRELTRYSVAASVAVLYYDYILTFNSEYNLFWKNFQFSWISLLYFLNRYMALVAHVFIVIEFFCDLPIQICRNAKLFHQLYCAISILLVAILSAIRTYALYNQNRSLRFFFVCFLICGFSIACWQILTSPFSPTVTLGGIETCGVYSTVEEAKHYAIAWSIPMMFDCIVFGLTLCKRLNYGRTVENGIFSLMLRDGTMYFSVIALFYALELADFLMWGDTVQMATLTNVMSTTLISRLMLNIRDPKNGGILFLSSVGTSPSTVGDRV